MNIHGLKVATNTLQELSSGKKELFAGGLPGSSRAALIASLALAKIKKPIVIITSESERGETLLKDISFFLNLFSPSNSIPLLFFPNWETLPYEAISPNKELSGQRLEVLERLVWLEESYILIVTVQAILQKVIPRQILVDEVIRIGKGEDFPVEKAREMALCAGYEIGDITERHGEVSFRGGIIDIFPTNSDMPYRIELFGDEVESVRKFDPTSQRSIEEVNEVVIVPACELVMNPIRLNSGIEKLLRSVEENNKKTTVEIEAFVSGLKEGFLEPGIERFSPYFYGDLETLFDYIPERSLYIVDDPTQISAKESDFFKLISYEYLKSTARGEFYPSPEKFYLGEGELFKKLEQNVSISVSELRLDACDNSAFAFPGRPENYKGNFDRFIKDYQKFKDNGFKFILSTHTKGQAERVLEIFTEAGIPAAIEKPLLFDNKSHGKTISGISIVPEELSGGVIFYDEKLLFLTEEELFGKVRKFSKRKVRNRDLFSTGLKDLKRGDVLVHVDYGMGKYQGTREITLEGFTEEFLIIEYADNNKLFLPMDRLGEIQRYIGSGDSNPNLDRLGGTAWLKTKAKVKKALMKMADELLKLYAARTLIKGYAFSKDSHFHREFTNAFEFSETEDQLRTISEITEDMEKEKPMDRLVCGDVGYGKTEVAMRAVFKAAMDAKQSAVLVPTTLLAQQHLQTFRSRFTTFPIRVEMLSRFKTQSEQKKIISDLENGEVDVVIGTHRLLQKDISFKDLGLVVIDEEQRFGVAHKDKLKQLKERVDVLTLTATPIPRTLHFAMMGVRDMSIIDTPPQNRLSIKTFVKTFDDEVISQAIRRELDRNGEVFFLHNRVESIHNMKEYLTRLVPSAKIGIAHGQMNKNELEEVMANFVEKKINLLLCTTIIESGLDIPSANTIIVNRADKFGLGQLYQLRGRVGRDRHQAYAYFLIPRGNVLSAIALKRLAAIEELSDLGSGFKLAARDLEIRGGGNLVGPEQSGHIAEVGFDFYCRLMEETIRELKGEPPLDGYNPSVSIFIKGFIPKEYVQDLNQRLDLYKRLDQLANEDDLKAITEEMKDRYGAIPEPVEKLTSTLCLKLLCRRLKIEKIENARQGVIVSFMEDTPVSPEKLIKLIKSKKKGISFVSEKAVQINSYGNSWKARYVNMELILRELL